MLNFTLLTTDSECLSYWTAQFQNLKTATTKTCELKSKLHRVSKLKKWEIWFLDFHMMKVDASSNTDP